MHHLRPENPVVVLVIRGFQVTLHWGHMKPPVSSTTRLWFDLWELHFTFVCKQTLAYKRRCSICFKQACCCCCCCLFFSQTWQKCNHLLLNRLETEQEVVFFCQCWFVEGFFFSPLCFWAQARGGGARGQWVHREEGTHCRKAEEWDSDRVCMTYLRRVSWRSPVSYV